MNQNEVMRLVRSAKSKIADIRATAEMGAPINRLLRDLNYVHSCLIEIESMDTTPIETTNSDREVMHG